MTLCIPAKMLLHVWSYDFYDMTLSTGKQRRHMINQYNAPVICNHGPHPRGRAGDSRGNERGFDQSFATAVRRKYLEVALYRQNGRDMKR